MVVFPLTRKHNQKRSPTELRYQLKHQRCWLKLEFSFESEIAYDEEGNHSQDVHQDQIPSPPRRYGFDNLNLNWDFLGDEAITILNPDSLNVLHVRSEGAWFMFKFSFQGMCQSINEGLRFGQGRLKPERIVSWYDINVAFDGYLNLHRIRVYRH